MTDGSLETTNLLLAIMAAVSIFEALALVAIGVIGYRLYSQTRQTVRALKDRMTPLVADIGALTVKVDGILDDVKAITARTARQAARVDSAIDQAVGRVDDTAARVRGSIALRLHQASALMHGVRRVVQSCVHSRPPRAASAT